MKKKLERWLNPIDPEVAKFRKRYPKPSTKELIEFVGHTPGGVSEDVAWQLRSRLPDDLPIVIEAIHASKDTYTLQELVYILEDLGGEQVVEPLAYLLDSHPNEYLGKRALRALRVNKSRKAKKLLWERGYRDPKSDPELFETK